MKFVLICFTLISIFASPTVYAQQSPSPTLQSESGLSFSLERSQLFADIGSYSPSNDQFLAVYGTLFNSTNQNLCAYASEAILNIGTNKYIPVEEVMDALQVRLDPFREYMGYFKGVCINGVGSETVFLVYDIPKVSNSATLSFQGISIDLDLSQTTSSPSATPIFTSTPIPASVLSDGTNSRGCPSTSCSVLRVVNTTDSLGVIGIDYGWYLVELPNGDQAYVRSDLVRVPEGVEVPSAPTLPPTSALTMTSRPTNTWTAPTAISARATEAPYVLGDDDVLVLIQANMYIEGFEIDAINRRSGNLIVDAPATALGFSEDFEYRVSYLGYLVGSVVAAYEGEDVNATAPSNIIVQFKVGNITTMRITLSYHDAVNFINGNLTTATFISRWIVE